MIAIAVLLDEAKLNIVLVKGHIYRGGCGLYKLGYTA